MHNRGLQIFRLYGKYVYSFAPFVIIFWLIITAILNIFIPQLEKTIADKTGSFLPNTNPGIISLRKMAQEFHDPVASGLTNILFVDEQGISPQDEAYYQRLLQEMRSTSAGKKHIAYVLDIYGQSTLKKVVGSEDGKAFYLITLLTGQLGSSQTEKAWEWLHSILDKPSLHKPANLRVVLTGPAPMLIDELHAIDSAMNLITLISVVIILLMLLLIYRSVWAAFVPLLSIGVSLACARAIISWLGQIGILPVSSFSLALSTAIILGAGTDYAVFLLGRYQEERRIGTPPPEALRMTISKTKGVVLASGLTVAATSFCMGFMKLGLFRTAGPPIALGVLVTLLTSFSFCPALMTIFIRWGFLEPRTKTNTMFWRKRALFVLNKPALIAVVLTGLLLLCSSITVGIRTGYLDNKTYSSQAESNQGIALSDAHYPPYKMFQEFMHIDSDHDMRNAKDLAAIELASRAVALSPVVRMVQGQTRPFGSPYPDATINNQSGIVKEQIEGGLDVVHEYMPLLNQLAGAAQPTTDMQNAQGYGKIISLAKTIIYSLDEVNSLLKKSTHNQLDVHQVIVKLHAGIKDLVKSVNSFNDAQIKPIINKVIWANKFLQKMDSPVPTAECRHDLFCMKAREFYAGFNQMTHGGAHAIALILTLLPNDLYSVYQSLKTSGSVFTELDKNLTQVETFLNKTSPPQLKIQLNNLLSTLQGLAGKINGLNQKLIEGDEYLTGLYSTTSDMSGGFYLPPRAFKYRIFIQGEPLLFSPDGKSVRMLITFKKSAMDPAVFDSLPMIYTLAHDALEGTSLATASISSTGTAAIYRGLKSEVREDTLLLAIITILAVLCILMILLRSIIAPLVVMGFVLLSVGTTIGITVLVSQYLLGHNLHWSVLPVTLMVILAVGSDYSMLFVSRIQEECTRYDFNRGMIRAFENTGSIITVAGLAFAITIFALLAGGVEELQQIGFAVGVGLLIDILVIRVYLVPAVFVILGERSWWPSAQSSNLPDNAAEDMEPA